MNVKYITKLHPCKAVATYVTLDRYVPCSSQLYYKAGAGSGLSLANWLAEILRII